MPLFGAPDPVGGLWIHRPGDDPPCDLSESNLVQHWDKKEEDVGVARQVEYAKRRQLI